MSDVEIKFDKKFLKELDTMSDNDSLENTNIYSSLDDPSKDIMREYIHDKMGKLFTQNIIRKNQVSQTPTKQDLQL